MLTDKEKLLVAEMMKGARVLYQSKPLGFFRVDLLGRHKLPFAMVPGLREKGFLKVIGRQWMGISLGGKVMASGNYYAVEYGLTDAGRELAAGLGPAA